MSSTSSSASAAPLQVRIFTNRVASGAAAATHVANAVRECVEAGNACRMVFGCAPSQDDFFRELVARAKAAPEIWAKAEVFHMDDYVGLNADHPQSFRRYLHRHLLDHVPVAAFHLIRGEAADFQAEAERYAALLARAPIDVVCMGIGENGHIAFNDPPVANFNDPVLVKVVELDSACRQQQVNDGCFPSIDAVPRHAFTITLPVFANARRLSCVVPTSRKAAAVHAAITGPVGTACPATLLRSHPCATIFLDEAAAALLPNTAEINGVRIARS
jgi:glucosamine-6-phosphate deaminase